MKEVSQKEAAEQRAYFLYYRLRQWYEEGVDTDPEKQAVNDLVFRNASKMLKKLASQILPKYTLVLEVGNQPVQAYSFEEENHKIVFSEGKTLKPRSFLCLDEGYNQRQDGADWHSEEYEVFLGDFEIYVATSALAKTLYEDGRLKIVSPDNARSIKLQSPG